MSAPPTPQPAGNVLIVEDDPDVREMLAALLVTEGFHAVAAEDGLEALHLLRTVRHRAPQVPCLILLDLMMPRLSGNEFRRAQLGDPTRRRRAGRGDVGRGRPRAAGAGARRRRHPQQADRLRIVVESRAALLRVAGLQKEDRPLTALRSADARTEPSAAAASTSAGTGRSSMP